jgi:hypothetical protein
MYEVFDSFLAVETWYTQHVADENRFFLALSKIVQNDGFNPDEMGEYFKQKTIVPTQTGRHPFQTAIRHYANAAWAIKDYLAAVGGASGGTL